MNIDQTTITSVAAILSSKELLQKILGPSADYIGGEIKNLIEKCNINLGNIFFKTQKKLGDKINEAGQVSPRVLKNIIDEGKFCEDEIQTEYYGGLLASARTPIGRDDRPVFILNLVKSMSVYQLRLHYLFYYSVFNLFRNSPINLGTELNVRIKIALNDYDKAMDFSEKENRNSILLHSVMGLKSLGIIGDYCAIGSDTDKSKCLFPLPENGIIMEPTILGAEVFLYAQGYQNVSGVDLLNGRIKDVPEPFFSAIPTAKRVQ